MGEDDGMTSLCLWLHFIAFVSAGAFCIYLSALLLPFLQLRKRAWFGSMSQCRTCDPSLYTLHYIALHYITLRYNNCYITTTTYNLQLQLQLRYTTLHPAVVVMWPLQPLQPLQKTQLQPPVGPSVDSLCHPWFTTTSLSYRFPIFGSSATALRGTTGNR